MNKLLSSFIILIIGLVGGHLSQPFIQQQLQIAGLMANSSTMSNDEPKILYWVAPMDANYRKDQPEQSPMGMDLVPVYEEKTSEPEVLYWVAPMDANYRRDKPGKSPMGMDLVPFYAENSTEEGVVKISPVVQNNLGIRTATAQKGILNREINTVGYISFDEEKLFHLHTRVEGWVEKLVIKATGDPVKKGQKLFELYSPALVNAQEEYLTALRSKNKILISASTDRLSALGISKQHIKQLTKTRKVHQRIDYNSKNSGFIKDLKIREGMFIKPSMDVLTIGQIDTVWVIAEVFERQSGWVKEGQNVTMNVAAYPQKKWAGKVDYIYPVLDDKTRTLRVRIRFNNKEGLLKPNMFSRLTILSNSKKSSLLVKREAIIRNGQMERVVKSLGDGKFLSVKVETGNENSEFIEILSGLNESDVIVTSAQFLIDSESSLTASFNRMDEPASKNRDASTTKAKSNMMDMSAMSSAPVSKKLNDNQAWVRGKVLNANLKKVALTLQHEPVESWGWPEMKMDFPVDKSVNIEIFERNESYNFLVEKHKSGSIKIVDFNKKESL
ncbi:MAG: efflux RND transporter periplasmic adaptor subunit [Gammaproteobacteria bacterium]|nr:efflux RND transporter periplasmic adaptor subunit [Gammaproteobacteria bacterium]